MDSEDVSAKSPHAPFTSERLRNLVFDHLLDNSKLFIGEGPGAVEQFTLMLDSLESLAMQVASEAIANRQNLSPLPTFNSSVHPDPYADLNDDRLYEMRYRVIEQIGSADPVRDEVLTRAEAEKSYGPDFLETYWGALGERCPNSVVSGDRTLWFSVVRYPVSDNRLTQAQSDGESKYRAPSLG